MRRTLLFAIGGLLLGAGVHVAVVLSVPMFSVSDAWARSAALGADGEFHTLAAPGPGTPAEDRDPHLLEAVCRFSLQDGPVRMTATLPDGFWSVGVFDRRGRNLYSLNDRAGDPTRLDVLILTPAERAAFGEARLAALQNAIVADLAIDAGLAVIRVFLTDDASVPGAVALLAAANCNASL